MLLFSPRDSGTPLLHFLKQENARTVLESGLGFLNPLEPNEKYSRQGIMNVLYYINLVMVSGNWAMPRFRNQAWVTAGIQVLKSAFIWSN